MILHHPRGRPLLRAFARFRPTTPKRATPSLAASVDPTNGT